MGTKLDERNVAAKQEKELVARFEWTPDSRASADNTDRQSGQEQSSFDQRESEMSPKDQVSNRDYSNPSDHSEAADKSALSTAEASASRQGDSQSKAGRDIAAQENILGGNSGKTAEQKALAAVNNFKPTTIKGAVKKKVAIWAIGLLSGIGSLMVGSSLFGGSLLLQTIAARISDGYANVVQRYMSDHSSRLWAARLNPKPGCTGAKCQFHTMSKRQVKNLAKSGYTLFDDAGNKIDPKNISGKTMVKELQPPDDVKLTGGEKRLNAKNITEEMAKNPKLRKSLRFTYSPKFAGFSDKIYQKIAKKFKFSKKGTLPDNGDKDQMDKASEKANNGDGSGDSNYKRVCNDSGDKCWMEDSDGNKYDKNGSRLPNDDINELKESVTEADVDKVNSKIGDASKAIKDEAADTDRNMLQKSQDALKGKPGSILASANDFIGSGIASAADKVCGVWNAFRAITFAVKVIQNADLIAFALGTVLPVASAVMAGDATPDQVAYLGNKITQVAKNRKDEITTASGTDAVGLKFAMYGDRSDPTESLSNSQNSMSNGPMALLTNSILSLTDQWDGIFQLGTKSCNFIRGSLFQGAALVLSLGTTVVSAIATGGASIGINAGVKLAAKEAAKAVAEKGLMKVAKDKFNELAGKGLKDVLSKGIKSGVRSAWSVTKALAPIAGEYGFEQLLSMAPTYLQQIASGKVVDKTVFGEVMMDKVAVGFSGGMAENAKAGGGAPLRPKEARKYAKMTKETALAYAEEERVGKSWFDISSPYTALGAVVGDMTVNMSGATSSPTNMVAKLVELVTSSPKTMLNNTALAASDADDVGTYECGDYDYHNADIGCNYLGTISYGLTTTYDPDETADVMYKAGLIDESGNFTAGMDKFNKVCIDREIPIGSLPLEDQDQSLGDGTQCMQDKSYAGVPNTVIYNYIAYQRAGEGMDEEPNGGDGGSGSVGASFFGKDAKELASEFEAESNGGDVDGGAGRQCVDLSYWFVKKFTTLTPASVDGQDVVGELVKLNPGKAVSTKDPEAPAIFSATGGMDMGGWTASPDHGHTGVVIKVDDDGTIHTIETGNGSPVFEGTYTRAQYQTGMTFVNLKQFLKEQ